MIVHNSPLQKEVIGLEIVPTPSSEVLPYIRAQADTTLVTVGLWNALEQRLVREEELIQRAEIDHLTGLRNQRAFHEEFEGIVEQAHAKGETLAAMFIDLDNFGEVNKKLGHTTGNAVLERIGAILPYTLRAHEDAYRAGGDEFIIVMPNFAAERSFSEDEIIDKAERASRKIAGDVRHAIKEMGLPTEMHIGASYGYGILRNSEPADQFLARVESYMTRQKLEHKQQHLS